MIGFHLGEFPIVVVNDSENVKKVLNHRDFDGRPDILMGRLRHPELDLHGGWKWKWTISNEIKLSFWKIFLTWKKGIFFTEGDIWHDQRRFTLRYLRDFGFGRRYDSLEKELEIQIAQCINLVKNGPKYPHEEVSATNDNWLAKSINKNKSI